MSVQEYNFKFTQFSRYAQDIVTNMKSKMSLFMFERSHLSTKEGKNALFKRDIDIVGLMIHGKFFE